MTDAASADAVRDLLARQAILDCLHRYTRGVDRVDEELIRSAFHADAVDYHGWSNGSIDDFLAAWLPRQGPREVSMHYTSNHAVLSLDVDSAVAETYFTYYQKLRGDPGMRVVGGRYVDRFERREGDWRIAMRIVIVEWEMEADGSPTGSRPPLRSRRDRSDLSYRLDLRELPAEFL